MADYKAIKGFTIQSVSSDPSNPIMGQVWYNTTTGKLKGGGAAAWATGNTYNDRRYAMAGAGTQTAAGIASGYAPGAPGVTVNHEQYDGTSWSELANVSTARFHMYTGAGTTTAALFAGGTKDPGNADEAEVPKQNQLDGRIGQSSKGR